MSKLISVDFNSKQITNAPLYTIEQVMDALAVIQGFMEDNLTKKEQDVTHALQVMDHDLENISDEELDDIDALETLKRRRALRQCRRELKDTIEFKKKIAPMVNLKLSSNIIDQHIEKMSKGSCDRFFDNTIKRKDVVNKYLIKRSRLNVLKQIEKERNYV